MTLNKEQILGVQDCKLETINVPEWGGDVCIRAMSGGERDAFRATIDEANKAGIGMFEASLLTLTLVDESGKRLFELSEVEALRAKSAKVLDALANQAMRINGMGVKAQEDAVKNSEAGQSDSSGSGSPKN